MRNDPTKAQQQVAKTKILETFRAAVGKIREWEERGFHHFSMDDRRRILRAIAKL